MGLLNETDEKLLINFLSLKEDDWIQWIAQENNWNDDCDKLNGCYFIVKNMPMYPQHFNCQCRLKKIEKPIPNVTAQASCDIRKFTEYIFNQKQNNGKKDLFESWGYSIRDSEYLKQQYISQALQKYCNGEYQYKGTNGFIVKIEIEIEIKSKSGKLFILKSGWSLLPNGVIKLVTPFSGFSNQEKLK